MSKGSRIFLVVAFLWAGLWVMGSVLFFRGARTQAADADYVSKPLTEVERGSDVRIEGTIDDGATIDAPLTGTKCVAALVKVFYVSEYEDSSDKSQHDSKLVDARHWGASRIGIRAGSERLELPLEAWEPRSTTADDSSQTMYEVPPRFLVSDADISRARSSARGRFEHFVIDESRLVGGTAVFVVAHIADRPGTLELEPDPALGRIEIHRGTQAELVSQLRGMSFGFRIAGWIFAAVSIVPLIIFGILQLRSKPTAAPAPSSRAPHAI
ncbi:MAG: hypothetical protein HOV80_06055 [Polyangiaceae bacterium]|nr:hypothetical protein [Polyangiaceae bacterium]